MKEHIMRKIYVVEDDKIIAAQVKSHLEKWDFEVRLAADFKCVAAEFAAFSPQMVLLDIYLPYKNGYFWCEEIRKLSNVPIIFLSSAADNMNIVMAMSMGADDFIAKPFDLSVLTAKIQALFRRAYSFAGNVIVIEKNGVMLDLSSATLIYGDNKIDLTKNDFRIVQVLMENAGHVVSREDLMIKLWESDSFIDDNTLTVNVTRLRKKLAENGISDFIITKKGLGYLIP